MGIAQPCATSYGSAPLFLRDLFHARMQAVRVLLRFYLELRQQSGSGFGGAGGGGFGGFGIDEGATITTRQIEALVRMCEVSGPTMCLGGHPYRSKIRF